MRTYLNLEKEQIETLLKLLAEIHKDHRNLSRSEQFVERLLNEALDRVDKGW
jgi:hypothetical protein